jgi:desulfoferrodoxin-like iron-binding protein
MFPHDTHPPGYQDTGRCKKSTQTWKKQPVTSYWAKVQHFDFWEILQQKELERDSCSQVYLEYMEIFIMVNVSKEGQVFRCEICGNVVVVKESGGGELICCGEPMQLESA